MIYKLIIEYDGGIKLTEIQRSTGISHKHAIEYHLHQLLKHRFIKKVNWQYYPIGVATESPLKDQIQNLMDQGIQSPTEIAKIMDTSRQRVWYHIKKMDSND